MKKCRIVFSQKSKKLIMRFAIALGNALPAAEQKQYAGHVRCGRSQIF